jgi:hypothetical protein
MMFELDKNYPNPFNATTTINYIIPYVVEPRQAPALQHVTQKIYDVLGREAATLIDEYKIPGVYSVQFTPSAVILSGIYLYRLKYGSFTETKKMTCLK